MGSSPPVIPDIVKAYENDPRTKLALQAMATGQSTAPVALGKYGMADGIARLLGGLAGTYSNSKQEDKYTAQQAALLATAKAQAAAAGAPANAPVVVQPPGGAGAVDTNGQPVGMPPPGAPVAAPAIAAALGSPPPSAPPPGPPMAGPPGIPTAPIPAPGAGGGPMGQPPFGPGRPAPVSAQPPISAPSLNAPHVLAAPVPDPVPAAPAPVERPVAPAAEGATRSRLLDAAYRIMTDANPYQYQQGQDMYTSGLADQTKLDESATERKQRLADMGYQSDLGQYSSAQEQDRGQTYAERLATEARNAKGIQDATDRTFQAGESSLTRANAIKLENMRAASAMAVEKTKAAAEDARAAASAPALDPATLQQMAQQAWAGDKSVFTGLGRGAGGARNIIALRKAVNDMGIATGKNGADLAAMNAQFAGATRAAQTAGQRVGAAEVSVAELPKLTDLSSQAYKQLPRGQFVPFNQLQRMVANNTSSPEQAAAFAADFAVINAYARALSPSGQPHEADKKRATEMLNGAYSQDAHQAVLDQINRETQAIKSGASEALTGGGGKSDTPPPAAGGPLSDAEKAELLKLRKKYGK